MRFGLNVNPGTWEEASRWAAIAEDTGFDGLWTGDNMRNPRDPAIPVHDGPTLIAAWAATTKRIRVGMLIANVVFRRPTVLAKQAVTLDHISGGRFELGIGAGLWPTDHGMSGVPIWSRRERSDRLAEFVAIIDRLLSGDVDDHQGAYYSYEQAAIAPAPLQTPMPLIVAANGPKASPSPPSTRTPGDLPRRRKRGGLLRVLARAHQHARAAQSRPFTTAQDPARLRRDHAVVIRRRLRQGGRPLPQHRLRRDRRLTRPNPTSAPSSTRSSPISTRGVSELGPPSVRSLSLRTSSRSAGQDRCSST